jgi:hypothetical protein
MFILVFLLVFGVIGGIWASAKRRNPIGWGLLCAFLPLIGLVILAFQKPLPAAGRGVS